MTQNAPQLTSQVITILVAAVILLLFAISVALPLHGRTRPGSSGHRKPEDDIGHEDVQPDGFIDSFSKEIEEAGGGLPPLVKYTIPAILIWYVFYLITNWAPR
jgi:hypothetical protein